MRIQAYTRYQGTVTITASTLRPGAAPSTKFTAATIHEDYAANVRALLEEHIHIAPTGSNYAAAARLQTYFPLVNGDPIYCIKELMPAGTPRAIDAQFMLEITSIRYQFTLDLLPAAFASTAQARGAIERAMEFAIGSLLKANGVPDTYIPGDNQIRPEDSDNTEGGTEIDIFCQLGQATLRTGVDIPAP